MGNRFRQTRLARTRQMPDIVDTATRSRMMSGIRSKNTKPELQIRSLLHRQGFRFRVHVKGMPGKPDIVLPRHKAVVLVNGCFWHGHDCALFNWPGTRKDWWREKILRNRQNDARTKQALMDTGWRVAVVWECTLKGRERISEQEIVDVLSDWISSGDSLPLVLRGRVREQEFHD